MSIKFLAIFALGHFVAALIDKPLISPPMPSLDQGLLNNLKPTHSTHSQWKWGWIPQDCKTMVQDEGFNPYDVEVFNIHYTDCPDVWIFCRHNKAPVSQIDMINIFGRMPVRMRQYVRHMLAVPGVISAGSSGDNIVLKGTGPNLMTVFVHETAHSMDSHAIPATTAPFHDSPPWIEAVNQDSAISDSYAQTNQGENFAQETVIALFDKVVPGGIRSVQPNWRAIFHQYATAQGWLGDQILPGGTCQKRLANSAPISMGHATGHGARLRSRDAPDVSLSDKVEVIQPIPMTKVEMEPW
ncbi:hypothetical protein EV426DRAFT_543398 [Tirmania nivea]|nr:hypothetical protein EV426DRAFT_543398 [Tirmania nivea]